MAMQFDEATAVLTDSDVWMDVGMVAGGYLAPYLVDTATGTMLPSEVFGLGGMALGEMVVSNRAFTLGSGAFVVREAAERFNAQGMINEVLA
ncbi:hypothetical protein [Natronorubrum aibiense]|uniref:Uncharacterized protein n=1 Tax=Natronorubrum aibiense TaxID=348826 RepID=A0A5P9P617_9EURY|nr:hypothetical protein [Natronorubrum aibiense]QFU83387.1 hypothetical protein GCU68_12975 [Natronorubrum aibiense]